MNKFLLILSGLLWFVAPMVSAQDSDFGIWTSLEVKKKIFPGFDASFEGEFRTRNDVGTIDRWSAGVDLSYSVNSYLKLGGAYNLINYNHPKREWEVGHRYSFYATGSYVWNRIELSLRESWYCLFGHHCQRNECCEWGHGITIGCQCGDHFDY